MEWHRSEQANKKAPGLTSSIRRIKIGHPVINTIIETQLGLVQRTHN